MCAIIEGRVVERRPATECRTGVGPRLRPEPAAAPRAGMVARGADRLCRWVDRGAISHLVCYRGFECHRCEVDERMLDSVAA
ncbi:MAG: hypothetical protein QME96_07025 [Myxococcota bacterium]|nr:hypothetical protein [Myxococcota bacterium]